MADEEFLDKLPPKDLIFNLPPTFETSRRSAGTARSGSAAALRLFGKFGFEEGVAGHITARDPELTDHFWVNPFGMSFKHIRVSDLILVNHEGEVVEGRYPVNEAAFAIHSQVHQARPDVVAAAHSHSVYGRALSALGRAPGADHPGRLRVLRGPRACSTTTPASSLDLEEGKRIAARPRLRTRP